VVDATLSAELIKNIFFPKAALHDGAVVVRDWRIAAAGCVLPLTQNPHLSRELGTRHRAAIGITEHTDAVVVVVSEETGVISCVSGGNLRRYLTADSLAKFLREELVVEEKQPVHQRLLTQLRKGRSDDHEAE
jgi:diadenylate cyclase